jgi:hypothetical protein
VFAVGHSHWLVVFASATCEDHDQTGLQERVDSAFGERERLTWDAEGAALLGKLPRAMKRDSSIAELGQYLETQRVSLQLEAGRRGDGLGGCSLACASQDCLGHLLAVTLSVAPATTHRQLIERYLRSFEHSEFCLLRVPLTVAELYPFIFGPSLQDQRSELRFGQVEASEIGWEVPQLNVKSHWPHRVAKRIAGEAPSMLDRRVDCEGAVGTSEPAWRLLAVPVVHRVSDPEHGFHSASLG